MRRVSWTLSNIYDDVFLRKYLTALKAVIIVKNTIIDIWQGPEFNPENPHKTIWNCRSITLGSALQETFLNILSKMVVSKRQVNRQVNPMIYNSNHSTKCHLKLYVKTPFTYRLIKSSKCLIEG